MSSASPAKFVLYGAAGFGLGGPLAWSLGYYLPLLSDLSILLVGAVGGASLGLALGDRRKLVVLALLGGLGTILGLLVAATLGSFVNYSLFFIGPVFGNVLGASLGLAFLDIRRIVTLAVAGAVGFGMGLPVGNSLSFLAESFENLPPFRDAPFIFVAGVAGGAALGAAMGYLQRRGPAGRQGENPGRSPSGREAS